MNIVANLRTLLVTLSISIACAVLLMLGLHSSPVYAATLADVDQEWTGVLEARPDAGLQGEWVVSGRTFIATEATEFDDDRDELVTGACVEVEYWTGDDGIFFAAEVEATDDDCQDDDGDDGDDGDDDEDDQELTGIVESRPTQGLLGPWVISGQTVMATALTEFDGDRDELVVGACAEVEYWLNSEGAYLAAEIEVDDDNGDDDNGDDDNGDDDNGDCVDDSGDDTGESVQETYGRLDTFLQVDAEGEWVIDGTVYLVNADTEFEEDHGGFESGACVEVEFIAGEPNVAVEIETESDFKCRDDDDQEHASGELYGVIEDLPEDLMGEWQIGGLLFTVNSETELEADDDVDFASGVMVEVEFYVGSNGQLIATEIEAKYSLDDEGDDDGDGTFAGISGHAVGTLESMPAEGSVGTWTVSGIEYRITGRTLLIEAQGSFTLDVTVRIRYYVDSDGNRVALLVKTIGDGGGAAAPEHHHLYGYVNAKPVASFNGVWVVNGVELTADQSTTFNEARGVLAASAYVEVDYIISNGVKKISLIETHVPPGAGGEISVGAIQSMDVSGQAEAGPTTVWVVGGVEYTVLAATDLNETHGELAVGSHAVVDSYTDSSGKRVATEVRGVTLDQSVYLPYAER